MKELIKTLLLFIAWFVGVIVVAGLMITTAALDFFAKITEGIHERRED